MWNGLLPIGSVVLLKDSEKRVMVIGFAQAMPDDLTKVYDYCGCLFPEGYVDGNNLFLFNHGQIDTIYSIGYMDEEQFEISDRILAALTNFRDQQEKNDQSDS